MRSIKEIPFYRTSINDDEINEVVDTLRSGWLTTGPKCQLFEKMFAEKIGCKTAIAVCSCTAAIHLALVVSGIKRGDEVLTSPYTFAATAGAISYVGATPVFVDVSLDYNIDVTKIEEKITDKTKAIVPIHFAGLPCDMDEILRISKCYKLKIIEDAAHAFPARYKDTPLGNIGDFTCFSFYVTKNITTAEGGMITTNLEGYKKLLKTYSLHGIDRDVWRRGMNENSWYYEIISTGYKYNLSDISASIGIHQLKKIDLFMDQRSSIVEKYNKAFSEIDEIILPPAGDSIREHAWHLYVIRLKDYKRRDEIIKKLFEKGISTSVHFIPIHMHPYYREYYGFIDESFPVAHSLYVSSLSLPLYPSLKDDEVDYIIEGVKNSLI